MSGITRHNLQTLVTATGSTEFTLADYEVSAGTRQVLVVTAHLQRNSVGDFTASCTYGGAAMTEAKTETDTSTNRQYRAYVWYLVNPTVGTADVVVSVPTLGAVGIVLAAECLRGVAQTGTVGITTSATGSTAALELTLNGLTGGSLVIAAVTTHSGGTPTWTWTTATENYDLNNGNNNGEVAGSGGYYAVPSNGNVTLTATRSAAPPGSAGVAVEFIADGDEALAVEAGLFALSGQAAGFRFWKLAVEAGSLALSGQNAALRLVQLLYGLGASKTPRPAVQVLVGDASGRVLGEVRGLVERVSWELGGTGSGQLTLGSGGLDEALARPGNRVLVQTDTGLPAWGGVMTGAMEWDDGGRVHIELAGLLHTLKWRRTPAAIEYTGKTVDAILNDLIAMGGLRVGTLAGGTEGVDAEYHFANVYDAVMELPAIEDMALEVESALSGGTITGTVNLFRRGSRAAGGLLVQGHNAREIVYREEDALLNSVHVIGGGEGWSEATRARATVTDVAGATRYGLREEAVFYDEVTAVNALAALGEVLLGRGARPRQAAQLTATNRSPGPFAVYGVGDLIRLVLPGYGFGGVDGTFEVVGREYFPGRNVCDVVLEGWNQA